MRKIFMTAGAAAFMFGSLATATWTQSTHAAPHGPLPATPTTTAAIQLVACDGNTGPEGCGGGWHWRWGPDRGWACYPC